MWNSLYEMSSNYFKRKAIFFISKGTLVGIIFNFGNEHIRVNTYFLHTFKKDVMIRQIM
jgi:hypothetical protein